MLRFSFNHHGNIKICNAMRYTGWTEVISPDLVPDAYLWFHKDLQYDPDKPYPDAFRILLSSVFCT